MSRKEPYQHLKSGHQFQFVARRFARWKTFGLPVVGEYGGDNRSFSTSDTTTYRTAAFVVFDLDAKGRIVEGPEGHSTGCLDSDTRQKVSYSTIATSLSSVRGEAGRIAFKVDFRGKNSAPDPAAWVAPEIDTQVRFEAFLRDGHLCCSGALTGDPFPDGEVFVRDHRRTGRMLAGFKTDHNPSVGPLIRLPFRGENELATFSTQIELDYQGGFLQEHDKRLARVKIAAHEPDLMVFPSDALFDFGKSSLRRDAIGELQKLAATIKSKNITKATIIGHTDSTGPMDNNLRLSKARAQAVKNWLILNGVSQAAFYAADGKGESAPIASNGTSQGRQRNRRVEILFR